MDRKTYIEEVLGGLSRLTPVERTAVRAELDAHIEDHICDLLELGYEVALAEERTMTLMGDPQEVGRELNKQYPLGWLVLKWAAAALTLMLVLASFTCVNWDCVDANLTLRFRPWKGLQFDEESPYEFLIDHKVDIRETVGDTVVRVCAVAIYEMGEGKPAYEVFQESVQAFGDYPDDQTVAAVWVCGYPASLWDVARNPYCPWVDIRGKEEAWFVSGGMVSSIYLIPVERGEEQLTASYDAYGYQGSFTIPLNWEEVVP